MNELKDKRVKVNYGVGASTAIKEEEGGPDLGSHRGCMEN